jgi:hypothetical protein
MNGSKLLDLKGQRPVFKFAPMGELFLLGAKILSSPLHYSNIVKQLDSLSTSKRLKVNVSNECISKVGACLYTNQLHQMKELRSMVK